MKKFGVITFILTTIVTSALSFGSLFFMRSHQDLSTAITPYYFELEGEVKYNDKKKPYLQYQDHTISLSFLTGEDKPENKDDFPLNFGDYNTDLYFSKGLKNIDSINSYFLIKLPTTVYGYEAKIVVPLSYRHLPSLLGYGTVVSESDYRDYFSKPSYTLTSKSHDLYAKNFETELFTYKLPLSNSWLTDNDVMISSRERLNEYHLFSANYLNYDISVLTSFTFEGGVSQKEIKTLYSEGRRFLGHYASSQLPTDSYLNVYGYALGVILIFYYFISSLLYFKGPLQKEETRHGIKTRLTLFLLPSLFGTLVGIVLMLLLNSFSSFYLPTFYFLLISQLLFVALNIMSGFHRKRIIKRLFKEDLIK